MNILDLPIFSFLRNRKKHSEYFLSLVLRNEKVSAVVFEELAGKVNVVGEHVEPFTATIEEATDDELLDIIDRAVSIAEKNLPEGVESKKTIFGVKESWIEEGPSATPAASAGGREKIKKEYLGKLKKVSDELGFSPMGFLVIPEAIAHLLQKEEGAPISAILAEIGKGNITLSLIKGGKIIETKTGTVGDSIIAEVEKLIKSLTTPSVIPPRIILFDGGKEELQQEFIGHKWTKESGFMHLPQVSSLPANFDARAVLNGAAKQMGFEVLEDSLTKAVKEDRGEIKHVAIVEPDEDKTLAQAASEFGFTTDDVKKDEDADDETKEEAKEEEPMTAVADNFERKEEADMAKEFALAPEELKENENQKKPLPPLDKAIIGAGILGFLGAFKKLRLPSFVLAGLATPRKALFMLFPLAFIVLYLLAYFFLRSATITLGVDAKKSQQDVNVTFSNSDKTNADSNVINAQFLTVSEDGKLSTPATGKKETGDKAKGTVTIFNNNSTGITLSAGTTITSDSNLSFTTDKAVTIASASGDIFSGTTPGKATVTVTAEKFGTNYNLPSSSKFSVAGQSDVAAKNDNAFSGGTKKDIKVVAQADLDKLTNDIKKNLESQAKDEIQKKATGNSIVLPNFISITFDKRSFSKDVGDEANEVSITAVVVYEGVSYQRPEIISFAQEKLKKDISKDLTIDEGSLDISSSSLKKKDDLATAKITIKADLIPKVDQGEVAKKVAGKSSADASSLLRDIPQVTDVYVKIFPNLFPQSLPFSSGKIKIVVSKNG